MKLKITFIILIVLLCQVFTLKYQAKLSSDMLINSQVGKDQSNPIIATLSNGYFVAVWDSQETTLKVLAQIYDSSLNKVGDEIYVGTTDGDETMPFVIDLRSKNRIIFFWQNRMAGEINFRIYDYNGKPVTDTIKANALNSYYSIDYSNIRVASTSSGNFLISWQVMATSIADWDVRGRLFDSNGKPLTDDFKVSDLNGSDQSRPSVCTLTSDNFVVAYHGNQSGSFKIYFKIYDPQAKTVIKPETFVSGVNTNYDQKYPYCAALTNGGFVIAYATNSWARDSDLALIIFDKEGNRIKDEFRINTVVAKSWVTVAPLGTGGFVVTYSSTADVVCYQVFSADGTSVFSETKAASANPYYYKQRLPFVSSFNDSSFVITWEYDYTSGTMRKAISMNLFEVAAGDCVNLQVYSGRTPASELFANISPIPTIMIKQEPENGTLYDSDGNQIDTVQLYQMNKIFYKSNAYNDDSFYYIINKGEEACKVDIVMCYPSCQTCSETGDSLRHNCDSCPTSEGYYPLSDSPSQCYLKTDIINGYEFDANTNTFIHTSAGYYYNNYDPSATQTVYYEYNVGVGTILMILIPIIVFIFALIIIIIICKRRRAVKPSQATQTNNAGPDIENNNPPTYAQEETGQTNPVKVDEKFYQKL
jgi:hypothetical protein